MYRTFKRNTDYNCTTP